MSIIERKPSAAGAASLQNEPGKSLAKAFFSFWLSTAHLYGASYRVKKEITSRSRVRCDMCESGTGVIHNQSCATTLIFIIVPQPSLLLTGSRSSQRRKPTSTRRLHRGCRRDQPARPAEIPFDGVSIIDSDGLLSLKHLPTSVTIVGGGVIGCEYACILATLGIPVVLVERRPRLLEFVDSEIIEALQYQMRSIGVTLRFNEEVVGIDRPRTTPLPCTCEREEHSAPLCSCIQSDG